jgi:hypothetical protein
MEATMTREASSKHASGSDKKSEPDGWGDHIRKAQEWGGGSKGAKGGVTAQDRNNQQSSAKSGGRGTQ